MMHDLAAQLIAFLPEAKRHYGRCLRKIGYASQEDAAEMGQIQEAQGAPVLYTYPCPDCGLWHLTKQAQPRYAGMALDERLRDQMTRYQGRLAETTTLAMQLNRWLRQLDRRKGVAPIGPRALMQQFSRLWELHVRCEDLAVAIRQRELTMACAQAQTAAEVQALERGMGDWLAWRAQVVKSMRAKHLAWRDEWQPVVQESYNRRYVLPRFEWRQHLTQTDRKEA